METWRRAILPPTAILQDVIRNLNEVGIQVSLIVHDDGTLIGTISDGDIRRGILRGLGLDSSIESVIYRHPLVVPASLERDFVLQLMTANQIRQIPVIDSAHRVIGLHLWNQVTSQPERDNLMVIMAGGKGTRMRPHTETCPKPMLMVAGKPMLEHIVLRAKAEGFRRFVLAIHYLGHMVESHFGSGEKWGIQIEYLRENCPLGTAGALSLLESLPEQPLVVTNGDVITDIRYGELLAFHQRHHATATMAVRLHEWQHPFGVVQMRGVEITGFEEKPVARTYINAGVYVLASEALQYLEKGDPCDMPTLFENLRIKKMYTVAYPMHEPWLDVGRPDDLDTANSINIEHK